jgi:hypothetical protein
MAEPTLSEVFGAGSSQNSTSLTIQKSDLAVVGLTAGAGNTAESLLTAIVLLASRSLTESNRASDTVNRNISVNYGGQDLVQQGDSNYRRDAFSMLLYKPTTLATVDPDDY